MEKSKSPWFARIASIANKNVGGDRYRPEDVQIILKAWRMDYQAKQSKQRAELKIQKYEAKLAELKKVAQS